MGWRSRCQWSKIVISAFLFAEFGVKDAIFSLLLMTLSLMAVAATALPSALRKRACGGD
jgi:hypothetical protein